MEGICFLNDHWIYLEKAYLHLCDLGFVRGYGVFDYIRTYQKKPFHLYDHLLRLQNSADLIGLKLPYSLDDIEAKIADGLEKISSEEVSIKVFLSGGFSEDQLSIQGPTTFCIMLYPFKPMMSHKEGLHVITTVHQRPLPQAKSTCYLSALAALKTTSIQPAHDVLYLSSEGHLLEGATSNLFVVKNQQVITPISPQILPGITRDIVRRCLKPDMTLHTPSKLPLSDMSVWDEMFLTSSNREIVPVFSVNGNPVGSGTKGPITQEIQNRFRLYTESLSWTPLQTAYSKK